MTRRTVRMLAAVVGELLVSVRRPVAWVAVAVLLVWSGWSVAAPVVG